MGNIPSPDMKMRVSDKYWKYNLDSASNHRGEKTEYRIVLCKY